MMKYQTLNDTQHKKKKKKFNRDVVITNCMFYGMVGLMIINSLNEKDFDLHPHTPFSKQFRKVVSS